MSDAQLSQLDEVNFRNVVMRLDAHMQEYFPSYQTQSTSQQRWEHLHALASTSYDHGFNTELDIPSTPIAAYGFGMAAATSLYGEKGSVARWTEALRSGDSAKLAGASMTIAGDSGQKYQEIMFETKTLNVGSRKEFSTTGLLSARNTTAQAFIVTTDTLTVLESSKQAGQT